MLKGVELSDNQLDRLSEFCANLGLVFFAGLLLPIFSGIDKVKLSDIIVGASSTLASLIASLILSKGKK